MRALVALIAATLVSCGGGGGPAVTATGSDPAASGCTGNCASATTLLSVADVQQVIAQAVAEAQARQANATIAVVDRVGNVLAVYRMGDPATRATIIASSLDSSGTAAVHAGLEGIRLPATTGPLSGINLDELAAIAKAITGAYLSSEGNAFSSRTASQIVQQHFDPGTSGAPSGPLFGVQFSQLACSTRISRLTPPLRPTCATPGTPNRRLVMVLSTNQDNSCSDRVVVPMA